MLSIGGGVASEGVGAAQTVYDKIKPLNAPLSCLAPTAHQLSATAVLDKWCVVNVPLGDAAHMRKREQVLHDLTSILQGWVRQTYLDKGFPADVADQAGGAILTSGVFYDPDPGTFARWKRTGHIGVEMEAAMMYTVAAIKGMEALAMMTVSDLLEETGDTTRISDEDLKSGVDAMMRLACEVAVS